MLLSWEGEVPPGNAIVGLPVELHFPFPEEGVKATCFVNSQPNALPSRAQRFQRSPGIGSYTSGGRWNLGCFLMLRTFDI